MLDSRTPEFQKIRGTFRSVGQLISQLFIIRMCPGKGVFSSLPGRCLVMLQGNDVLHGLAECAEIIVAAVVAGTHKGIIPGLHLRTIIRGQVFGCVAQAAFG